MSIKLGLAREDVIGIIKKELNIGPKTATVTGVSGGKVRLEVAGETAATQKYYKYVKSYTPTVGDRVYIDRSSGTYVVLGKI